MKTALLVLAYLIGIGELILAVYFWATNSKNEIRRVMALLAVSTGLWVILSALTSYIPFSTIGYYELAATYLFAILSVTSVLHFSLIMPFHLFKLDKYHATLLYTPVIFFGYALFFTKTVVVEFTGNINSTGSIIGGPLFGLYNLYLVVIFFGALAVLFYRSRNLTGLHRTNLVIILWSLILGGVPAALMYLIIPLFVGYVPFNTILGNLLTVFWVSGTWYVIKRS